MIHVRDATDHDIEQIKDIFVACYDHFYAHPQYYDINQLKKLVFSDDMVFLVAEDTDDKRVLGTSSVVLDVGAHADMVGEFGRLAVHPDARGRGIGKLLMIERIQRVSNRLHLGIVENRVAHAFSQRISTTHGFVPVGFLPMKLLVKRRESVALYARYFGDSLTLRKNNPRVIPEANYLAGQALENCGLPSDCIVDDSSMPYPNVEEFEFDRLTTEGYASLLRIERGRVRHRDVFGPLRLHYGLFKLQAKDSNYLLARHAGQISGAIGFTVDEFERTGRIFELISSDDQPIRFLLERFVEECQDRLSLDYVEVDVSAYAPRMQRTLLELDFLPVAYVPAMVFHDVERLDAIKMVRLLAPLDVGEPDLLEGSRGIFDLVMRNFASRHVQPRLAQAAPQVPQFVGLNDEQISRIAGLCVLETFSAGDAIIREGTADNKVHFILAGKAEVTFGPSRNHVGTLGTGHCLGESTLLRPGAQPAPHSATATAKRPVETAVLCKQDVEELIRRRPDIGVVLFRNLAAGITEKLHSLDKHFAG